MSIRAVLVFLVVMIVMAIVAGPRFRRTVAWLLGISRNGRR